MAKFLSIEIDNCNIRIIEAVKKGETLSVCRCMSVDINYGIKDGKINDMNKITDVINEELVKNNIKIKKAVFVINSSSIMIRTIKLPLLKKSTEILSMIQIELQQMISADLSKYKIAYEISNITNENKVSYADYIVYCVPVILVNQYTELAERLKLKLIKIDILPRCINSMYKRNIKVNETTLNIQETTAFINIKKNSISFSVANNGFCDFYISSEIEKTYMEMAAESQSSHMYSVNYSYVDNSIVSQIIKFMRYYYSVSNNKLINQIFIYGNCMPETIKEIKIRLNIDVEILSKISNLTLEEEPSNIFELNKYFNGVLTLFSHSKDINFNTSKKKIRNNYRYAVILFVIMAASLVLFGFIDSQVSMRNKVSAMSTYIDDGNNNEINIEIEYIKKETDYLEQYLIEAEKLQQVIKDNDYVDSNILRTINMSKPSETKVTSIQSDKSSTQLQCVSLSMNEATLFFSNLREIEEIESAYMPAIQSKSGQSFSYSIVLKLKDVIENDN